jgi:transcriptional regulator with XRE-family HTH domain
MTTTIKKEKHPLNVKIGERIRVGRKACGLSQHDLGDMLPKPITFQQVQKYEKGTNRISVLMLNDIAETMQLPLAYFLEDLQDIKNTLTEMEWKILHSVRGLSGESQQALITLLNEKMAR